MEGKLYVFDRDGQGTHDYLQDTIDICKECAFEEFNVPINSWQEAEPLYSYTSSDNREEHLFKVYEKGPLFSPYITVRVQGNFKELVRFTTIQDCMQYAADIYRVPLDSWSKDI